MDLKKAESEHTNPTEKPKINDANWPKTLDYIEEYLRGHLGHTKILLAPFVQCEKEVLDHPAVPQANCPVIQDEMVLRAPHINKAGIHMNLFNIDNIAIWTLLSGLTKGHKCWTYVKSHQRPQDGQGGFLAL